VDYGVLLLGLATFALGAYVTWWTFSVRIGG
jgi:hypothetical protein